MSAPIQLKGSAHLRSGSPSQPSSTAPRTPTFTPLNRIFKFSQSYAPKGSSKSPPQESPDDSPEAQKTMPPPAPKYETLVFNVRNGAAPSTAARAAEPPFYQTLTLGKRKRYGGRVAAPVVKKRRTRTQKGPTRLRRTVTTWIPYDIWHRVFTFVAPPDLLSLRKVCTEFDELISGKGLLRECAYNNFGDELPPPPGDMEWSEYLDLLDGLKCMSCERQGSRKTYWAFLKRWCESCFREKTRKSHSNRNLVSDYPCLLNCIMSATIDGFGNYVCTGFVPQSGRDKREIHLAEDLDRIVEEFESYRLGLSELPEEERRQREESWMEEHTTAVEKLKVEVSTVEEFMRNRRTEQRKVNLDYRTQREEYFKIQAQKMEPPLGPHALELIPEYRDSIVINSAPSERKWTLLKKKVEEKRAAAEKIYAEWKQAEEMGYKDAISAAQAKRSECDPPYGSPEQRHILRCCEDAIKRVHGVELRKRKRGKLNLSAIALRILQVTWEMYQDEKRNNKAHASPFAIGGSKSRKYPAPFPPFLCPADGKHELMLDDACMVFDERICVYLSKLGPRTQKESKLFKCPGCSRKDVKGVFSLRLLFRHIQTAHSKQLGDFISFRWAYPEPSDPSGKTTVLCAVPWTRNLPVLAEDEQAPGSWDPHAEMSYEGRMIASNGLATGSSLDVRALGDEVDRILDAFPDLDDMFQSRASGEGPAAGASLLKKIDDTRTQETALTLISLARQHDPALPSFTPDEDVWMEDYELHESEAYLDREQSVSDDVSRSATPATAGAINPSSSVYLSRCSGLLGGISTCQPRDVYSAHLQNLDRRPRALQPPHTWPRPASIFAAHGSLAAISDFKISSSLAPDLRSEQAKHLNQAQLQQLRQMPFVAPNAVRLPMHSSLAGLGNGPAAEASASFDRGYSQDTLPSRLASANPQPLPSMNPSLRLGLTDKPRFRPYGFQNWPPLRGPPPSSSSLSDLPSLPNLWES